MGRPLDHVKVAMHSRQASTSLHVTRKAIGKYFQRKQVRDIEYTLVSRDRENVLGDIKYTLVSCDT